MIAEAIHLLVSYSQRDDQMVQLFALLACWSLVDLNCTLYSRSIRLGEAQCVAKSSLTNILLRVGLSLTQLPSTAARPRVAAITSIRQSGDECFNIAGSAHNRHSSPVFA